jgi:hypothetical protein
MNQHIAVITPRRLRGVTGEHRFPDDLDARLLAIALQELPKAKPLRRSQLARRDYIPEPVAASVESKRPWFHGLAWVGRMVRPAVILIVLALTLLGATAARNWFSANFRFGALLPDPDPAYVLDEDYARLPDGRWVKTRYRGMKPSIDQLPPIAEGRQGDLWLAQGHYWVLTTLSATNPTLGWIDP